MRTFIFATLLAALAATGFVSPARAGNPNVTCHDGQVITDTSGRLHVSVDAGATCTLRGASVFSFTARDAANVYVYDTTVKHNIKVVGTTGDTVIGNEGCKFDPAVGNNIMVRDSHNVLICYEHVRNNIKVSTSDGKITVRDSQADHSNIMVSRNLPYVSDGPAHHRYPGAVRLLRNTAKEHIVAAHNSGRRIIQAGNSPAVTVR